ncbi:5-formyltetrahydrofolate cyclo-ligase [Undibacterium oligocarboniphilum]|nr:5-formyltetrahydrofolate cyclo-ligase [Undibacterium oligocarboniphilum]
MTQPSPTEHLPVMKASGERNALRRLLLQQRCQTAPSLRQQWDAVLMQKLLDWCRQQQPSSLAVYWPIQAEPDLRTCYPQLVSMGISLALPWVVQTDAPLQFLAWQPGDAMELDRYGIPLPAQRTDLLMPEIVLVPCVGFNADAYRLGYGGGFYDRTLAAFPSIRALGVAYHCAQADFLPGEHDIPMQWILTEYQEDTGTGHQS